MVPAGVVIRLVERMDTMFNAIVDRLTAPSAAPPKGGDELANLREQLQAEQDKNQSLRRNAGLPTELNPREYKRGVQKLIDDERGIRAKNAAGKRVFFCRISNLHQLATGRLIGTDMEGDNELIDRIVKSQYEAMIGSRGIMDPDGKVKVVIEPANTEKVKAAMAIVRGEVETKQANDMMAKDNDLQLFVAVLS